MIKRIVRMHFKPGSTGAFLDIFQQSSGQIRAFEGCHYLELVRDIRDREVFFTISHWDSQRQLDAYRASELFRRTWAQTKALFASRPRAWSTESITLLT